VSPEQLALREPVWNELERRLLLLHLGSAHSSSDMHDKVIARLVEEGPDSPTLESLRRCARGAREAVAEGDLERLGRLMTENTEAQSHLHEDVVNAEARASIDVATAWGAAGWKVNGAGGEGGSLTVLCGGDEHQRRGLEDALLQTDARFRLIPIRLSRNGLRVRVL
jgi:D-glycero-alpha-D-manno-heptose-7-phosphate kinase